MFCIIRWCPSFEMSKMVLNPFCDKTLNLHLLNSFPLVILLGYYSFSLYIHRPHPYNYGIYRVAPKKTEQSIQSIFQDFWSTVIFFPLLDRASLSHYNNTKIIGWELFILWVISYGLSFSGFARYPEFRSSINDKLMANPESDSP